MSQEINRDPSLIDARLLDFYKTLSSTIQKNHKLDFRIFEGHRTLERQKILVKNGFSKTLKSKHLHKPSKAIDVIEYPWSWKGFILSDKYRNLVNELLLNYKDISWGGSWKSFVDLPHFEINETKTEKSKN